MYQYYPMSHKVIMEVKLCAFQKQHETTVSFCYRDTKDNSLISIHKLSCQKLLYATLIQFQYVSYALGSGLR